MACRVCCLSCSITQISGWLALLEDTVYSVIQTMVLLLLPLRHI